MKSNPMLVIALVLLCCLAFPAVALSGSYSINTNDGAVDSNWSGVSTTIIDGDDYADDSWDINQAWVATNYAAGLMYFRIKMVGSNGIPEQNWNSVEAVLDCNKNGNYQEAADMVVFYQPNVYDGECQGDDYPTTPGSYTCMTKLDNNDSTFGEKISGSPVNYEWKADFVNNTNVTWSACKGPINVMFRTTEIGGDGSLTAIHDATGWISINVPTAVTVQKISARTRPFSPPVLPLVLVMTAAAFLGVVSKRYSR